MTTCILGYCQAHAGLRLCHACAMRGAVDSNQSRAYLNFPPRLAAQGVALIPLSLRSECHTRDVQSSNGACAAQPLESKVTLQSRLCIVGHAAELNVPSVPVRIVMASWSGAFNANGRSLQMHWPWRFCRSAAVSRQGCFSRPTPRCHFLVFSLRLHIRGSEDACLRSKVAHSSMVHGKSPCTFGQPWRPIHSVYFIPGYG